MKRKAKRCWYGLVICAFAASQAQAQDEGGTARVSDSPARSNVTAPLPSQPGAIFDPRFSGPPTGLYEATPVDTIFNPRITVDNRSNELYGYDSGYSTINAFMPRFIEENAMLFASGGGMVTYNGRGGANLGAGWRYYMQDIDRVVGLSAWYDFDAGHAEEYHQIGLSFESLGRYFDLRLNGYIPFGQDQNVLSTTLGGPIRFVQNQLRLQSAADTETAMTGFDSEIGGPMPLLGKYGLSGYAGFYYFTSSSNSTDLTGVSGRLAWQVNEDTSLGFQVTDDHVFGTNTQIQVAWTLPDGGSSRWLRQPRVRDRLMSNVFRRGRVTVAREIITTEVAAINPKDNQPYFVVHVDPNGPTNVPEGDGTVENPFNLISQYNNLPVGQKAPIDIIFVTARDDGTPTNLDTGVQLLDNQRLLSDAVQHTFMSQGQIFDLPGFDPAATRPILTNITPALPGAPVVTLANMNEVSGFQIDGTHPETINTRTFNIGIASQPGGITMFDINNNTIVNTVEAINIVSTGAAEGFIDNNEITGAGNRSVGGITVVHVDDALDLRVSNNVVTNVLGEDVNFNGVLDPTEDTNGNGVLDVGEDVNGNGVLDLAEDANGNAILDPGRGIRIVAAGPTATINANNPIDPNVPTGIFGNTVNGNGSGIDLTAVGGALFNAVVTDNLANNNTDPSGFGIRMLSDGSLFNVIQFADNQTNNNAGDGTQIIAQNGGVMVIGDLDLTTDGSFNANTFTGNGRDGLFINANNGVVLMEDLLATNFAGNTRDGLRILAEAGGVVTIGDGTENNLVTDNVFQSNGGNGATLIADNATINAVFGLEGAAVTNSFFNNIGNGLEFNTLNGGVINSSVNNNQAVGNENGLVFNLNSGSIVLASLNGNTSTGNFGDGAQINNGNGGLFTTPTIANNDFSNNGRAGLLFGGNLPAAASFNIITTITNNNFDRTASGTTGMLFETNNVFL
ncbi:MAG TPA: inverse autotransporter beta domain-containing protein, partial [Planctomycetaceae bacterium]|nr:inverse autotransporter beta domain-containing protein [Planctomycetaceae bacterium]